MVVTVNGETLFLGAGMTVRHAVTAFLKCNSLPEDILVKDRWGNLVGLDGALTDNTELVLSKKEILLDR